MGSIIWAEPWFILYSEQERGWYGWKKWRKYKGDNSANYKVVFLGNRGNCLYKLNLMLWLARRNTAIYAFGVLVLFKWSLSFDHIIWDIVSSDQILEWTNKNIINEWIDYPITTSFFLFFFLPHIEKILSKNQTAVIEFIFTGFFFFICRKMNSYFYLLLLIYLFIITGTLMVFFFIKLDSHLHTPMYFLISVLSFLEIWYTTTIIHKILSNQVSEQKTISLTASWICIYFTLLSFLSFTSSPPWLRTDTWPSATPFITPQSKHLSPTLSWL